MGTTLCDCSVTCQSFLTDRMGPMQRWGLVFHRKHYKIQGPVWSISMLVYVFVLCLWSEETQLCSFVWGYSLKILEVIFWSWLIHRYVDKTGAVVWLCAHSSGRFQGCAFRTVSYSVASRGRGQSLAPISSRVTTKGSGCFYPRLESSFVLGLPNFTIGLEWHPLVVRKGRETWRCCPSQKFGSHWLSESRFTVPSPGVGVG